MAFMLTSSNGNIFRVTGPLCREFTSHRWIPPHKGKWRGAMVLSLICAWNKRLSKQSWGWWFETPSGSLWRHCNDYLQRIGMSACVVMHVMFSNHCLMSRYFIYFHRIVIKRKDLRFVKQQNVSFEKSDCHIYILEIYVDSVKLKETSAICNPA